MAERVQKKAVKTSKRAQRRAQESSEGKRQAKRVERDDDDDDDRDSDAGPDSDDRDSDAGPDSDAGRGGDDLAAVQAQEEAEEQAEIRKIRDRNRRLRAKIAAQRSAERRPSAGGGGAAVSLSQGAARASNFAKRYARVLQVGAVVAVLGGIGWLVHSYRSQKDAEQATRALVVGMHAELGQIESDTPLPKEMGVEVFKDHTARLKAAEKAYRDAIEEVSNPTSIALARLGLAGVLLDQRQFPEAKHEYQTVSELPLAAVDTDVRGRSLEGVGLATEAGGEAQNALEVYKRLEQVTGFKQLGQYHQARLAVARDDKEEAKKLLASIHEATKDDRFARMGYVARMSLELWAGVDPEAAAKAQQSVQQSPEELIKQLQDVQDQLGGAQSVLKELGLTDEQIRDLAASQGAAQPTPAPTQPVPPEPVPLPSGGE